MSSKDILLLSSTPEILQIYKDALGENGCRLKVSRRSKSGSRKKKSTSPLVIVELKDNWIEELSGLHNTEVNSYSCIIVGSQKTLKENLSKVRDISKLILNKNQNTGTILQNFQEKELSLVGLLEQMISEFVAKTKLAGGKDLYPCLIREIERHLIRLTLKETEGNQVKAAQILGINRNTLRKKIKELKISPR